MTELLTHSRQAAFKACRKMHHFQYILGIRRETDAKALRQGTAFHDGLEALGSGETIEDALERVEARYQIMPGHFDAQEWDYERETVVRMVNGYQWRWQDSGIEYLKKEMSFNLPLLNPATGRPTPTYRLAGKIDGIVRLPDGRLAVIEHKLLGDDIGPESDLWRRMRMDHQVTLYVMAARRLGFPVDTVLYDCARKPTIKPGKVPILDDMGVKIVLNQSGTRVMTERKEWRQTGDKDRGYTLQEKLMTAEEWGEKLNADIGERPDFYFQRQEIPRMDGDLKEYERELWQIQQDMRLAERNGLHYRTVSKNTCTFCAVFDLCSNPGFDPRGELPVGYVRLKNLHPELAEESNGNDSSCPSPATVIKEGTATVTTEAPGCGW